MAIASSSPTSLRSSLFSSKAFLAGLVGKSRYYYSEDGKNFTVFGDAYQMMWGGYRGDRLAIYCCNNKEEKGFVDVDCFRYDYAK